jgi:hypothetical protein
MRAHLSSFNLTIAMLSSLAAGGAAAQAAPHVERLLLSQPLWTWQSSDAPDTAVWFEKVSGHLTMQRCPEATTNCRAAIHATQKGFELKGADSTVAFRQLPGTPVMFASDAGAALFPSWVVPSRWSRTGH